MIMMIKLSSSSILTWVSRWRERPCLHFPHPLIFGTNPINRTNVYNREVNIKRLTSDSWLPQCSAENRCSYISELNYGPVFGDRSTFQEHFQLQPSSSRNGSVCLSVCLSVRLSIPHTVFTMFSSSYHHEIFRSDNHWQKCPCKSQGQRSKD